MIYERPGTPAGLPGQFFYTALQYYGVVNVLIPNPIV